MPDGHEHNYPQAGVGSWVAMERSLMPDGHPVLAEVIAKPLVCYAK